MFVYNRLPWYLVKGKSRYYPQNTSALARLLESKVEYVVISRQSLGDIQTLLESAGQQVIHTEENEAYTIMQLR